jgi:uncharacterized membrane protein
MRTLCCSLELELACVNPSDRRTMQSFLLNWLPQILHTIQSNYRWMTWNLFLAIIPFLLSQWLFRGNRRRSALWVLGVIAFVAFLPNAPYVLTDVIHLVNDIRWHPSIWLITLIILPLYLVFILTGFEAYVLSLINLGNYLRRQGQKQWVLGAEITLHSLSAIGIYLGRFKRFNSWDLVTQLDTVLSSVLSDLVEKRPLVVIVITFFVIAGLYGLMKALSLAVLERRQRPRHLPNRYADVSQEE